MFIFFLVAVMIAAGVGTYKTVDFVAHLGIDRAVDKQRVKQINGKSTRTLVRTHSLDRPQYPHDSMAPDGAAPNDAVNCSVFEIRMTQQKMVDAGIIKADEMSVCENKGCKNCHAQREVERINRSTQTLTRGRRKVGGMWIDIPENIPDHAYPQICRTDAASNFIYVNWTWTDREGRKMFFRSVHPRDSLPARPQRDSKIKLRTPITRPSSPRGRGAVSPTKQACECCHYDIESGMGYINTFVDQCQPCNMKEAGRRSTGNMGPL